MKGEKGRIGPMGAKGETGDAGDPGPVNLLREGNNGKINAQGKRAVTQPHDCRLNKNRIYVWRTSSMCVCYHVCVCSCEGGGA
jgi:hypothetical protein